MSEIHNKLSTFILAEFIDPNGKSDQNIDSIIESLKNDTQEYARALVVKQALYGNCSDELKTSVLNIYSALSSSTEDVSVFVESARAAAVFEESDILLSYIERAESALKFEPKITGVQVKFGPHQDKPSLRLNCLAKSTGETVYSPDSSSASSTPAVIENIKIHNNTTERFETVQYISKEDEELSTSPLTNIECILLLLRSVHHLQTNASERTIVNEQILPYIRRITESKNFDQLFFSVQKHALYYRSTLEMRDIDELERGTVQLMNIGRDLLAQSQGTRLNSLEMFHQLVPLSWRTIDEYAARRLVAMSDFDNAIPIYRRLGMKFDLAVSLAATDKVNEALVVLKTISPMTGRALMLMADISTDPKLWKQAWDEFNEPKAKLRLANVALSENDPESALNHLNDLLVKAPTNYDALLLASRTSLSGQKWDLAAGYLKRALAINDDDAGNWSNLATALLQAGQPQPAHHAIKQAIRVNQNAEPNLPTLSNYISLSAQLGHWDEAVASLIKLCDAADRGSAQYVAKVSVIFPRLVNHYLKQKYTNEGMQKFVVDLFTVKLNAVVPGNDPMLLRLCAQLYIWCENYSAGLKSYVEAFDSLVKSGVDLAADARSRARLQLYAKDAVDNLSKFGDSPGRINGSTAYPGWKAKVISIEQAVQKITSTP